MRFGNQESIDTTARTLSKTQNNVKVLQHKAMRKMREKLKED
jgi:hypothetical protein